MVKKCTILVKEYGGIAGTTTITSCTIVIQERQVSWACMTYHYSPVIQLMKYQLSKFCSHNVPNTL